MDEPVGDTPPHGRSPRRVWFPFVWLIALAAIVAYFRTHENDPGVTNTVLLGAIALGVFGVGVWTLRSSGLPRGRRLALGILPMAFVAAFFLQLLPFKAINDGAGRIVGFRWRWADPDRILSADAQSSSATAPVIAITETGADYPRFLGNGYWAEIQGVTLDPNWNQHPPKELWRKKIGGGWSSFATVGDYAFTQEQRGDEELVVCCEIASGKPVWTHADAVRWDPGGAGALGYSGPRATPTVHGGKVFSLGATGILNCLDARTGDVLWRHDVLADHAAKNVMWGKASSPLVVDDCVVVSVGGTNDASLVGYEIADGKQNWAAGTRRSSYASPVLATLAGERQILSVDEAFLTAHRASDGVVLWEHPWLSQSDTSAAASQPVPVGEDRILLSMGYGIGAELVQVKRDEAGTWSTATIWKHPNVLKTKFGNVVIRGGYVYGLSDTILQCVELDSGHVKWKKRRTPSFGYGQILLAGDSIIALTESGEIVLFQATPKKYVEQASLQALEGITWNNPTLAGHRLLVRNAEEAACYELPALSQAERHDIAGASAASQ